MVNEAHKTCFGRTVSVRASDSSAGEDLVAVSLIRGRRVGGAALARSRRMFLVLTLILAAGVLPPAFVPTAAAAGTPCGPPVTSVIACENTPPGDPASDWQVSGAGDATIQGYATSMSVNLGETISFKINTPASSYHIDILRIGYYQGNGARKIAPDSRPPRRCRRPNRRAVTDSTTGLIDCGNWAVSASWTVPTTAVSGVYIAHLVRDDTGGDSQIPFVVRNDASHSDILVQTSDTTWQAYNTYGGNSLYQCTVACPPGNPRRLQGCVQGLVQPPVHTRADDSGHGLVHVRRVPDDPVPRGQRVRRQSTSAVWTPPRAARCCSNHKVFMSIGHDEYWSGDAASQRRGGARSRRQPRVLQRQRGVLEDPLGDRASTARTARTGRWSRYKETHFNAPIDPADPPTWTGTWRDPRFSPPADGGRPENALTGQFFIVNSGTSDITGPVAVRASCGSGATPPSRNLDRRSDASTLGSGRRHARLRVGRGRRQRLPAGRTVRPVVDDGDRVAGRSPTTAAHVDQRAPHASPDPVPRPQRRARLRRGHGAVGVGPRRQQPRRQAAPTATCSRRR